MKRTVKQLERLSEDELYDLSEAIDQALSRLARSREVRGYQRSTYMSDRILGKRSAPRVKRPLRDAA